MRITRGNHQPTVNLGKDASNRNQASPKEKLRGRQDPCDDSADDGRLYTYTSHDTRSESPEQMTVCLDVSYWYSYSYQLYRPPSWLTNEAIVGCFSFGY